MSLTHTSHYSLMQSGATEPLGSTAHPFASMLDPSPPKGYVSLAKVRRMQVITLFARKAESLRRMSFAQSTVCMRF